MSKYACLLFCTLLYACGDSNSDQQDSDAGARDDAGSGSSSECAELASQKERVACAANALLETLSTSERSGVQFALDDYTTRSKWSNLPVAMKPRAGVQFGSLSASSQAATLALMDIALNDQGRSTITGILRADDYLKSMQSGYGSDLYSVAIFGTPSANEDFALMFGGHHMAYNLTFAGEGFFPMPLHLGCEPKSSFTIGGASYAPLLPLGDAMFAVYDALDASQKSAAYLSGQSFSDVVVSPDLDYGKGKERTSKSAYPTGANRRGVIVASMTGAQKDLVTTAIEQWVRQYPDEVADPLMADYEQAYDDTYFAWGGASSGASKDASGSYLRIDGPRAWIELAVQGGIVIRGETHYHTIYRDKTQDYGAQF